MHQDNTVNSISNDCANTIYMPNDGNSTLSTKFLFSDARKAYYDFVLRELETRNVSFERTKLNSKGESVKVGIKHLIDILKLSMCPNQISESVSMSKSERLIFKPSTPAYLTVSHWKDYLNSDQTPETYVEQHCFIIVFIIIIIVLRIMFLLLTTLWMCG